ncbi:MAG TPA: hypothetical protein PKD56_10670, partial [Chitinophagales bacterium]|nr:hypothetical protein [Chitinophagales bacterium]
SLSRTDDMAKRIGKSYKRDGNCSIKINCSLFFLTNPNSVEQIGKANRSTTIRINKQNTFHTFF